MWGRRSPGALAWPWSPAACLMATSSPPHSGGISVGPWVIAPTWVLCWGLPGGRGREAGTRAKIMTRVSEQGSCVPHVVELWGGVPSGPHPFPPEMLQGQRLPGVINRWGLCAVCGAGPASSAPSSLCRGLLTSKMGSWLSASVRGYGDLPLRRA